MSDRLSRYWTTVAILFLIAVLCGGVVLLFNRSGEGQPLEISLPAPASPLQREVYIGGAVTNPGLYALKGDDSLEDILRAAGGLTADAYPNKVRIYVPPVGESSVQPQKINLNKAEAWLLQALPEIGEARAQAIIDYRTRYGPFRSIKGLTKVEGIGSTTFERVKDLVTVKD